MSTARYNSRLKGEATMRAVLLNLLALSSIVVNPLRGQGDNEFSRSTLAGLHGVRVIVGLSGDSDKVKQDGLSQSQLQTDVELKLRQSGIVVLSEQESPSTPALAANVFAFKNSADLYAVSMTVDLYQWARLVRNPSNTVWVSTWSARAYLGTMGPTFVGSLRDNLRDMTDQFINAYLAANPKR